MATSMSRKMLEALGIDEDKVELIIQANAESIEALKKQRDEFREAAEKLPVIEEELKKLKEAAKKGDPYEQMYNALKEEHEKSLADFEAYKVEQAEKEGKAAKAKAYGDLLKKIGIGDERIDAILKVSDLDSIKLNDEGKFEESEALENKLKEEWKGFIVTTEQRGAETPTPPTNNGNESTSGRIRELAKQYHENLYGKAKED